MSTGRLLAIASSLWPERQSSPPIPGGWGWVTREPKAVRALLEFTPFIILSWENLLWCAAPSQLEHCRSFMAIQFCYGKREKRYYYYFPVHFGMHFVLIADPDSHSVSVSSCLLRV